ncbi:MAG: hypothetical protein SFV53_06985 [Rickettsiales bacterium]|nr:hypothetical protein [Rickettsiales bacterium]
MSDNEINSIINQAKSEARSQLIKNFFNKNNQNFKTLITLAVLAVVVFAIFSLYQNSQREKFSEIFHQALIDQQKGDLTKAKESLQKIYESGAPGNIKALASLRYANIMFDENKKAEAAIIYQKVSECSNCDYYVKDLGGLLAVKTWLADENEIKKEDLLTRIEKIENDSKELRYQISEQKAFLHIQKNNLAKAYEILDSINKNPDVAPNIKGRISDSMKMIIAKGYEPNSQVDSIKAESKK